MDRQFIRPTRSATASHDALPTDLTEVLLKRLVIIALSLPARKLIKLELSYCVFASVWFAAVECLVVSSYPSDPIQFGISYFRSR